MAIIKHCPVCHREYQVALSTFGGADKFAADYAAWQGGALVQAVWPAASNEEREQIVSGICSDTCWDKIWPIEEDLGIDEPPF